MSKVKIKTEHPIAYESIDYLFPYGTKQDNSTNLGFINDVENYFEGKKIKFLDIGCSGGQLNVDFHNRGHLSVGIEGSDYSVIHKRANWPEYHNQILFTCDATKPYEILDENDNQIKFNCISAWEVIEHIAEKDFDQFFTNILNHMDDTSIFVGSVSMMGDYHFTMHHTGEFGEVVEMHPSIFPKDVWVNQILNKYFVVEDYCFNHKVRGFENGEQYSSFCVKLTKKKDQ